MSRVALLVHALLAMPGYAVIVRNYRPGEVNNTIDAHDGPVVQWETGGPFYRYAMSYTACDLVGQGYLGRIRHYLNRFVELVKGNGFDCAQVAFKSLSDGFGNHCGFLSPAHGQSVFVHRSWDLENWTFVGDALSGAPSWLLEESVVFRPAILYNPTTSRYVLWLNRLPRADPIVDAYKKSGFVVGTSVSPAGPFVFPSSVGEATPQMDHAGGADFAVLSHGDVAYIAYGSWHNMGITEGWRARWYPDHMRHSHQIALQKLDPTFTKSVGNSITVSSHGQEAPSWFHRGGYWYLVYGNTCCFCRMGSDARVYMAADPMGPYEYATHLNDFGDHHVPAQNSGIIRVDQANGSSSLLWTGDLCESAGIRTPVAIHVLFDCACMLSPACRVNSRPL